ncbi:hypothetical protein B0H66DRAFT_1316 [Apodospora peruviana]|uniref:Vacuolar sorting protein Vps3844 C-terminal domain-containing protein n=1 Tax=Apodospora peruviana TaxID=516989 RepID=A0AAE0ME12_9PEZI|nr:hypothetical protein B0H66DRAFT_1316 [Apodospora peruviana]
MRFSIGIAVAALSGLTTAASSQNDADVLLLMAHDRQQQIPKETPRLPKEVARHIFLQRTSSSGGYGSDLRDLPDSIDTEAAVSYIARYGKSPLPLFLSAEQTHSSSQLLVILEGATPENVQPLKEKLADSDQVASFAISEPPSSTANDHLVTLFRNMGLATPSQCDIASAINPFDSSCWAGLSSVVKYDLQKAPETISILLENFSRLSQFVADGSLEATLVLMPHTSRTSKINHWSAAAAAADNSLRRRNQDTETVIASTGRVVATQRVGAKDDKPAAAPRNRIPQCFASLDACAKGTNGCSGHGECVNKYGSGSGNATVSASNCFVCRCKRTFVNEGEKDGDLYKNIKTIEWGGNMCQKKDISVPFWLLAGFTITILGAVSFAIGLLFGVGQEPLPGVIGAGVIRSAK